MPQISAEWDEVIAAIRAKQQEPSYMSSAILALISCIDAGACFAASPVALAPILDAQQSLLLNAGCTQTAPAFQGVFHLSGTADAWSFQLDGQQADFDLLPRRKPRTEAQLLDHPNQLIVNPKLQAQLQTRDSRKELALALADHLRDSNVDENSDPHKLMNLILRVHS